jgi:hypothetical protein
MESNPTPAELIRERDITIIKDSIQVCLNKQLCIHDLTPQERTENLIRWHTAENELRRIEGKPSLTQSEFLSYTSSITKYIDGPISQKI